MEEYMEFSAKTQEEAITNAGIQLGTSSDHIDIQVFRKQAPDFLESEANQQSLSSRKEEILLNIRKPKRS